MKGGIGARKDEEDEEDEQQQEEQQEQQQQQQQQEEEQEEQQQMRQQKELEEELGHWGGVARCRVLVRLRLALALWRCQLYRPANACVCFLAFY